MLKDKVLDLVRLHFEKIKPITIPQSNYSMVIIVATISSHKNNTSVYAEIFALSYVTFNSKLDIAAYYALEVVENHINFKWGAIPN